MYVAYTKYKAYFTSDDDFTCTAATMEELVAQLDKYIQYAYGNYYIWQGEKRFENCLEITKPGDYSLSTFILEGDFTIEKER